VPFWINDNATGVFDSLRRRRLRSCLCKSIFRCRATWCRLSIVKLSTRKNPPKPTPAAPTGIIWNPSSAFVVPGTQLPAVFIFDTEDGTISAWAPGLTPDNNAVLAVDNSKIPNAANGAVYKGLAFGVNINGAFLFAANFRAGTIDVFGPPSTAGGLFTTATTDGGFTDPNIPAGFAPFGIQNINGDLLVTYAKQNATKDADVAGQGNGFVDVFDYRRPFGPALCLVSHAELALGRCAGLFAFGASARLSWSAISATAQSIYSTRPGFSWSAKRPRRKTADHRWAVDPHSGRRCQIELRHAVFTAGPNNQNDGQFGTITPAADTAANQ